MAAKAPRKTVVVKDAVIPKDVGVDDLEVAEAIDDLETHEDRGEGREKTIATVTHVLGLFTLFLGPLVMYFVFKRKASPWLRAHLDEAVNYHILLVGVFILLVVLAVVFTTFDLATVALFCFLALGLVFLAHVVFGVIAIIWAARGKRYHFPLDVKIVR